jgi:oligoendopeptidase F
MKIERPQRNFLPQELIIDDWSKLMPYFKNLEDRNIEQKSDFENWLADLSEMEAVLEEDLAWRYIRMTIDTTEESLSKAYLFFVSEIQPKLAPIEDRLNKKMMDSPFVNELESETSYSILFRKVRTALDLYRDANVPLLSELSEESQKFGALSAAQSIDHDGKKLTMQQAALFLKEQDESIRQLVYEKIAARRRTDLNAFNDLFNSLLQKRHQVALNAGFENFRDYMFAAMNRFDYTVADCKAFHTAVKQAVVPIVRHIQSERLRKLGKEKFKPWDLDVDPDGKKALKPFSSGSELLEKTIKLLSDIDPYFSDCLKTMDEMGHLDLESKAGKSPGGYNYPLYEIGVPFIFMNAVGSHRDLITMVHEGGHAIHSFLSRDLKLTGFKNLSSEIAELASMSMELLTMNQWSEFYSGDDLQRAKREHLEDIIKMMPWIAQVDEFQHWLYENPEHSVQERCEKWCQLSSEYGTGLTDWTGFEDLFETGWQRQLHIFEVPFYYIEYGIAQLGALGVWKNYQSDSEKAIQDYKNALQLGYTRSIPEIYKTANVSFDFSEKHISQLMKFVEEQLVLLSR